MTRKIWFLAILLLLSFFVTTNFKQPLSIAGNDVTQAPTLAEESTIVVGYSNWAGWWPWAIAEQKGLFAKNNVDVEMRWYDNYSQSMKDLAAGIIDANSQTLSDTISANETAKGEVVVLVNDNSAGNDKIIGAEGINKVEDLKGKQVLVEAGVVDDFLLTLALDQAKISRSDVKIIDAETGAAATAFAAGKGDAVGAFPPFWLEALEREGSKEIVSSKDFPGAIPDLLVVTKDLVSSQPQKVQALVDTWFDTLDFMKNNPESADEIMAKRAEVTTSELELFKKGVKMFSREDNLKAFEEGDDMTYLSFAAREINAFLQKNFSQFEKQIDLDRIFTSNFVHEASTRQ